MSNTSEVTKHNFKLTPDDPGMPLATVTVYLVEQEIDKVRNKTRSATQMTVALHHEDARELLADWQSVDRPNPDPDVEALMQALGRACKTGRIITETEPPLRIAIPKAKTKADVTPNIDTPVKTDN